MQFNDSNDSVYDGLALPKRKMICRLFVSFLLMVLPVSLYGQANPSSSPSASNPLGELTEPGGKFGQAPVEITAEGQTRYEGGLAIAENHVVIHYGDVAIYCEYAEYNTETHDVFVKERVRLYRGDYAFVCDRAVYNLETKRLYMADFAGAKLPFEITGTNLTSFSSDEYQIYDGSFTTSDSSQPDYHIQAKGVRIYPNDRIIFTNAWVYIKDYPVLWVPYLYQ